MEIKYIAHSSFIIKTKNAIVVTDPFANSIGFKFPKTVADIVTISHNHDDHSNIAGIEDDPVVLDWPGEFEVKSVAIRGISTFHDDENGAKRGKNIMYKIISEGINILHCGDLGQDLNDDVVEKIGTVDVLLIPVGGHSSIDPQVAMRIAKKIEPAIVIPMHYGHPRLDQKTFGQLKPITDFLTMMGQTGNISVPKLVLKHEDIASETNTKVVVLDQTA